MIWRGPMVMSAITQFLRRSSGARWTSWCRHAARHRRCAAHAGAASTWTARSSSRPRRIWRTDVRRGHHDVQARQHARARRGREHVLLPCPHCGTRSDIFGHGGARHEAERLGVPFLGEIPLHMSIRTTSDDGNPVVASDPGRSACRDLPGHREQGARPASGRSSPRRDALRPPSKTRFNQCSHAFVAFSLANFRVKAAPPERPE